MAELFGTDIAPDALTEEERRSRMFGAAPTPSPTRYAGATASPAVPSVPLPNASDTSVTPGLRAAREEIGTSAVDKAMPAALASAPATSALGLRPSAAAEQPAKPRLGGWKGGLLKALDVAGQIALPNVEQNIPGSAGYKRLQEARGMATQEKQLGLRKSSADIENTQAETGLRQAQTEAALNPKPEKPESPQQEYADAIADAQRRGVDPATDPKVQQIQDAIQRIQPDRQPQKPPAIAETLREQIDAANAKGDTATVKTLQKRLKDIDPGAESRLAVTVQGQAAAADRAETAATRKDVAAHDKAYVQPAEAVEKSYQMMQNAYNEYKAAAANGQTLPTGAQSMLALSTHLSTTFGNVKGARVTKDMIQEHLGARSISDAALVAIQKLTNGDVLSPDQWEAFNSLISQSRKLSWDTAKKEAIRKKIPVDFLPPDLDKSGAPAASGADGGEKAFTQADVDAAVAAHPGSNAQQIEQAFISKGWKKK
jgi:hypothetical protein